MLWSAAEAIAENWNDMPAPEKRVNPFQSRATSSQKQGKLGDGNDYGNGEGYQRIQRGRSGSNRHN